MSMQDVGDDLLQPDWLRQHLLHRAPALSSARALAKSVMPLVLASNHLSILSGDVMFWSMSRAS